MQQGPGVGPAEGPTGGPNKPNVTYILEEDKKRRLSDHLQVRILVKSNVCAFRKVLQTFYISLPVYHSQCDIIIIIIISQQINSGDYLTTAGSTQISERP